MFQIIFLLVLSYYLWSFYRRINLFILTKYHLMNNLSSIFKKKTFSKWLARNWNVTNSTWCLQIFLQQFLALYDNFFPLNRINAKDLQSPWFTNSIKESSKSMQNLCSRFFKNRIEGSETECKIKRNYFQLLKNVLKITTFPN